MRFLQRSWTPFLLVFVLAAPAVAQIDVRWFQIHDGPAHRNDSAPRCAVEPGGAAYAVLNQVTSSPPDVHQGLLVKRGANGALLWSRPFAVGVEPTVAEDLALDPATGDVVVVGTRSSTTGTFDDVQVARYGADGTLRWLTTWDGPLSGHDRGRRVVFDGNGNACVTAANERALVLAFDPAGALLWASPYAAPGTDYLAYDQPIALDATGHFAVTATGYQGPSSDIHVARIDPAGSVLWTQAVDGPAQLFDRAYDLATDPSGRIFVSGVVTDTGATPNDVQLRGWIGAFDVAGQIVWQHVANAPGEEAAIFYAIEVDVRGDPIVCGTRYEDTGEGHAIVEKHSAAGSLSWYRTFGDGLERFEAFTALALDGLGGAVAAGVDSLRLSGAVFESNAIVVRYDAEGSERWAHAGLFALPNQDYALDVRLGAAGEIVYAGATSSSVSVGETSDGLLVRFDEQGVPFCFGDGSGTACPCGNASAAGDGRGCLHSFGAGARLADSGDASRFQDTLVLRAEGMPDSTVLFVQGNQRANGGAGTVFSDGLVCIAGTLARFGAKPVVGGAASYPEAGDVPISVRGSIFQPGTVYYQAWYRNSAAFCSPGTFNLTSGLAITWGP